jgi:hypothetical protein
MDDKLGLIVEALKDKASLKQKIYRNTLEVFQHMKTIAQALAETLDAQIKQHDESVIVEFQDKGEFEFQLKFSGDLLMFSMHSNVQTFGEEHIISKSPYVQEDPHRGYFGSIMVYNFMADSLKYNRLNDPGYLLARMLLNVDGHFYIEGVRQLNFLFPDIAQNQITMELLRIFIESTMLTAIDQDLYAPSYQDIQIVPLGLKLENRMMSAEKVGFQMSLQRGSTKS